MVSKILVAAVLIVVWFFIINIVWAEIFTIQRGYQLADILEVSADEDVYDLIADISLVVGNAGACLFTFLTLRFLSRK